MKLQLERRNFRTPSIPKNRIFSSRIDEANESIDKSTMNLIKFVGVREEDMEKVQNIQNERINRARVNTKEAKKKNIKIMNKIPKKKRNISNNKLLAEIQREKQFGVVIKKRAKSIEYYKHRVKLKYYLEIVTKGEMNLFFSTGLSIMGLSRILNIPRMKKIKKRALSLQVREKRNNLRDYYERIHLEGEKARQAEAKRRLEEEKKRKLVIIKKRKEKDKYNENVYKEDKNKLTPIFSLSKVNTKEELLGRIMNMNKSNSRTGSVNTSKITTKEEIKSKLSIPKLPIKLTMNKSNSTMNLNLYTTQKNKENFNNNNNNSVNTETTRLGTKLFSTSTEFNYIKSFTSNFNFKHTKNNWSHNNININEDLLDERESNQSTSKSITKANSTLRILGPNNKFSPSKVNNSLYSQYTKLVQQQNILEACEKAVKHSRDLSQELGSFSHNKNALDLKNKLKTDPLMAEMNKEMKNEGKQFKTVKRFFIYPKKGMREFICDDDQNMINKCKQVERIKDDTAFMARDIIRDKFQTKLMNGEIINYTPDYSEHISHEEFIKAYKKSKADENFRLSKRVMTEMQIRKGVIKRSVDDFLRNAKSYK